jgi:methylglutaconyl-CoA hydratase
MAYRFLDVQRDGVVEHLTLNRPDVRNAFNDELIAELASWAKTAATDERIRTVVLAGAGPVFCAGADVNWMQKTLERSEAENLADAEATAALFEALDTLPFPLVGRIHGAALGGGAGLAAVCDVAIAADDAIFGFTEARLGILPAVISPYAIAKIGVTHARHLFVTARRFSADEAHDIGLAHIVVPVSSLDETVERTVSEILSGGPRAVAAAKALIARVAGRPTNDVRTLTSSAIARQRVSPEGQEGLRAFLEKRSPAWARKP